jgi:hypothetical protein
MTVSAGHECIPDNAKDQAMGPFQSRQDAREQQAVEKWSERKRARAAEGREDLGLDSLELLLVLLRLLRVLLVLQRPSA